MRINKAETARLLRPVEGNKNERAMVHTESIINARIAEGGDPVIIT